MSSCARNLFLISIRHSIPFRSSRGQLVTPSVYTSPNNTIDIPPTYLILTHASLNRSACRANSDANLAATFLSMPPPIALGGGTQLPVPHVEVVNGVVRCSFNSPLAIPMIRSCSSTTQLQLQSRSGSNDPTQHVIVRIISPSSAKWDAIPSTTRRSPSLFGKMSRSSRDDSTTSRLSSIASKRSIIVVVGALVIIIYGTSLELSTTLNFGKSVPIPPLLAFRFPPVPYYLLLKPLLIPLPQNHFRVFLGTFLFTLI